MTGDEQFVSTVVAAGAAVVAALLGIGFQAYAQRRAARLTLLDKGLEVVLAADRILQASRQLALLPATWVDEGQERWLAVRKLAVENFLDSHSSWEEVEGSVQSLFGSEVETFARDVSRAARLADRAAESHRESLEEGTFGPEGPDRERVGKEAFGVANESFRLRRQLTELVFPYVARERSLGLSWLEMAERRRLANPPWWTDHK